MKTQHTPGEWKISNNTMIEQISVHSNTETDCNPIAFLNYQKRRGKDNQSEQEANARLIAAAPELLKALQDALNRVSEAIRNEDIPLDLIPDKVLTKWEKAIQKATQPTTTTEAAKI